MSAYSKNYNQTPDYSKDIKSNYTKSKYYPQTNPLPYQQSPTKIYKQNIIKIDQYQTKRSKQAQSPIKNHYSFENQKVGDKQKALKSRFEQIRKKYDSSNKRDIPIYEKSDALQQTTKTNTLDHSFNRLPQKKTNNYSIVKNNKQIMSLDEKYNQLFRKTDIKDLKKSPEKEFSKIIPKQKYSFQRNMFDKFQRPQQQNQNLIQKTIPNSQKNISEQQSLQLINQKIQKLVNSMNDDEKVNKQKNINPPAQSKYQISINQNRKLSFGNIQSSQAPKTNIQREKYSLDQKFERNQQSFGARDKKPVDYIVNRSYSVSKPLNNTTVQKGELLLSNGKDVDEQIRKIQQRIKKSEDQKRKLNIKFEGYIEKSSNQKNKTIEIKPQQQKYFVNTKLFQKNRPEVKKQVECKKKQQTYVFRPSFQKLQNTSKFVQSEEKDSAVPKLNISYERKVQISKFNPTNNDDNRSKIQTGRLIQCFKQQVLLDQKLRDGKLIFSIGDNHQKWRKIKQQLQKFNIYISESQLKKQFEISSEQHDPFYSTREATQVETVECLAKKYVQANNYFVKNIKNRFNSELLNRQRFREQNLDLDRKGHLTVQDFVRYLNIETGTFYRNRDLILLFRRFSKKNELQFKQLLRILSK